MFHLIIDDILDRSDTRRGRPTMHTRFGELNALMVSGYIVADGYAQLGDDLHAIGLFSELLKRLGVAECMQWRLRRQPLGVEDWRRIAGEDTGSMFESLRVPWRPQLPAAQVRRTAGVALPRLRRCGRCPWRRGAWRRWRRRCPRRHPDPSGCSRHPRSHDRCPLLQAGA